MGKPRILSIFPNSFNEFNKTLALMYDRLCLHHKQTVSILLTSHEVQPKTPLDETFEQCL